MEGRISGWPTLSVLTVPSFPLITKLHSTCGDPSASYISKANFTKFLLSRDYFSMSLYIIMLPVTVL